MPYALPEQTYPSETTCVQIEVPNDPIYIANFWGQGEGGKQVPD